MENKNKTNSEDDKLQKNENNQSKKISTTLSNIHEEFNKKEKLKDENKSNNDINNLISNNYKPNYLQSSSFPLLFK